MAISEYKGPGLRIDRENANELKNVIDKEIQNHNQSNIK